MILRNKKTREIGSLKVGGSKNHYLIVNDGWTSCGKYNSLAELNAEWEDYEPKQPLIKDEKIRKAVRTWAEANNVSRVSCDSCVAHKKYLLRFSATELFNEPIIELYSESEESLWDNEHYTIAELCGEEEE